VEPRVGFRFASVENEGLLGKPRGPSAFQGIEFRSARRSHMLHGPYSPPIYIGGRQSKVLGLPVKQLGFVLTGGFNSHPADKYKRAHA
jgi:hypothetical protein